MMKAMQAQAEKQAAQEAARQREAAEQEEAHRRKYAIVDRIREEMAMKDAKQELSVVDSYALKAQAEFMQVSMKELRESGMYTCPPKYLNQRDTPLEIPMECIRKICDAMDSDFDDRVSL